MDFRNCIIDVTRILAQSGHIFTDDHRRKYLKLYSNNQKETETKKTEEPVLDVGLSESFSEGLAVSSTAVLDAEKTNNDLPVSKWMESLLTHKEICRIKQTGLRVGANCNIETHDIVLTLKGNVLQQMAGFKVYQRYGADYAGIIIFNLGDDHGYKWFCTKEYANTLQADIIQHGLQSNCEIFILSFKSKLVPIIYATRNIQENEYLCLSKQYLSKLNESFLSWNTVSTGNVRRSNRVPNRSKAFEEMYETHIVSKKQDGLEKRIQNGESGIFTTRAFSQGEFLVEYFGELIDETTALGRLNSMPAELGPYIFFLGSRFRNFCIDASHTEDSLARFVGHSIRKSNCKTVCMWMDETPRVFLVAKNSIEENTQLFYDYDDRNTKFPFLSE